MLDIAQMASIGTFVALAAAIGVAFWDQYLAALPPRQRGRKDQRRT